MYTSLSLFFNLFYFYCYFYFLFIYFSFNQTVTLEFSSRLVAVAGLASGVHELTLATAGLIAR